MCTTAPGISEELMPGLIDLCFAKRRLITRIMLIPVQAGAGPRRWTSRPPPSRMWST